MLPDQNNECTGSASFTLTPDYIGLPNWIRGSFAGYRHHFRAESAALC
jgi:hypothetical protein